MTTPLRPVPGAFFNTPAPSRHDPVRRRLFEDPLPAPPPGASLGLQRSRSAGGTSRAGQQPQLPGAAAPQPHLARAGRSVNQVLQQDEGYPDLDSYCRRELSPSFPGCCRVRVSPCWRSC